MVGEIIVEAIALVALLIVAFVFGQKRVRLIDRQHANEDEFVIAPPRRDRNSTAAARELNEKFRKYNRTANIETETLICLPSETAAGFFAAIEAFAFTFLLAFHHFDGISQFMIGQIVYNEDRLFEGNIGALFVLLLVAAIFGILFDRIIINAAKARAERIGENRAKKHRTVRFVQAYSIDEIATRIKWAVVEEIEERKVRRAANRRQQVTARRHQSKSNNVIQLSRAVNN